MSEQDSKQTTTISRPLTNDPEAWKAYWKEQEQPWRTEPEIDEERQKYLAERRTIEPDIEQGIYPFRDIKLSRADVEWLLETHESGESFTTQKLSASPDVEWLLETHESGGIRGPVKWNDERQRKRVGLDLRGANLSQEDLGGLPLAGMQGG